MEQLHCPRCQEPLERGERFCNKCGLRKCKPFSPERWWSIALSVDLLLMLSLIMLRQKGISIGIHQHNIDNGTAWWLINIAAVFLLFLTLFIYQIYRIVWLHIYGLSTSGKVVRYRKFRTHRGREVVVSVINFSPDCVQPSVCQVEDRSWIGALPLHTKVKVFYDPYNPGNCAWSGSMRGDIFVAGFLGLFSAALFIILILPV